MNTRHWEERKRRGNPSTVSLLLRSSLLMCLSIRLVKCEGAGLAGHSKSKLGKLISGAPSLPQKLPLVHSTDAYTFANILKEECLAPAKCDVFNGEVLTYFFYGRPAYRPAGDEKPLTLQHYCPVVLIFKPDLIATAKRIFPFDTGAFNLGLYAPFLHQKMKLEDFELEASPDTPSKVVSLFFGTNEAYLSGKPSQNVRLDASDFEAQSYLGVIEAKGSNMVDSRSSSIELQTNEPIMLDAEVAAVILPQVFLDGKIGESLKGLNIDALPYASYAMFRPAEFMAHITTMCFRYYAEKGWVKETL